MAKDTSAQAKLSRMKARLLLEQPFYGALICGMPVELSDEFPTAATNGKWLKFNPEFVDSLSPDELFFLGAHEILHNVFQHCFRRNNRDPARWNKAADYVINDLLVQDKVGKMPKNGLHDPALLKAGAGTTEGVYNLLPDDGGGPGKGGGQGPGGALDEVVDAEGSEAEQGEQEAEWKVKVAQAAQAAKMAGQLSGGLARLVDQALRPKVNWKEVLREFLSSKAKTEYSYARPKRRWIAEDLYLPSLTGEKMGVILIAADWSGSVTPEMICQFAGEIGAIKEDLNPERLHLIYFHSEVARHDEFGQDEPFVIGEATTGGTAFSPIFRYALDKGIEPVACVVLTDLICSDFGPPPDYPVLWVTTEATHAPWGRVVEMSPKL